MPRSKGRPRAGIIRLCEDILGTLFMPKSHWKCFIWEMLSTEWNTGKHHESQTPKQWCQAIEYEKSWKKSTSLNYLKQVTQKIYICFCPLNAGRIGIWKCMDFEERAKPEYLEKNLSGQSREPTTQPTYGARLEMEPGPHWWEAIALTTSRTLHSVINFLACRILFLKGITCVPINQLSPGHIPSI